MNKHILTLLASVFISIPAFGANTVTREDATNAYSRGDYKSALHILHQLANHGDLEAGGMIGFIYSQPGALRNCQEAIAWTRKAAEKTIPVSEFNLGTMYDYGNCLPQSYAEAAHWYQLAARQGYISAISNLGSLYMSGQGVKQDYSMAFRLFKSAGDAGDAIAQFNLGIAYERGFGTPKNLKLAIVYYEKAAEQGQANAQCNLGMMLASGKGTPPDIPRGYMWIALAAEQNDALAKKQLAVFESQASSRQIAEGKRLLSEWKQTHR